METLFKSAYGLYLDEKISKQDWSVLRAVFCQQAGAKEVLRWTQEMTYKTGLGLLLDGKISKDDWAEFFHQFYSQVVVDRHGKVDRHMSKEWVRWTKDVRMEHRKTGKESNNE